MWAAVFIACVIAILAFVLWLAPIEDAKMIGVVSGLLTGLVLFTMTLLTQVYLVRRLGKYERLGVINLLKNRHEREYYSPLLAKAQKSVKVMGSSATRFLDDFLDEAADDHVLLDILRGNTKFLLQILVPHDLHMSENSRQRWLLKAPLVKKLEEEFAGRFEVRRLEGQAILSFIIIDEDREFVGGPVLDTESRHGPAVHLDGRTVYALKHAEYFDNIWAANWPKQ